LFPGAHPRQTAAAVRNAIFGHGPSENTFRIDTGYAEIGRDAMRWPPGGGSQCPAWPATWPGPAATQARPAGRGLAAAGPAGPFLAGRGLYRARPGLLIVTVSRRRFSTGGGI
jgi:hypothetical protein